MTDKLPEGPKAPARKKRTVWSGLSEEVQAQAEPVEQKAVTTPVASTTKKKKGWDRGGQISVVLGTPLHERLREVQLRNAFAYESVAHLVRAAITEKLDRMES